MAITKEVPKGPLLCRHPGVPNPELYGIGTHWRCDDCGKEAHLISVDGPMGIHILWAWLPVANLRGLAGEVEMAQAAQAQASTDKEYMDKSIRPGDLRRQGLMSDEDRERIRRELAVVAASLMPSD